MKHFRLIIYIIVFLLIIMIGLFFEKNKDSSCNLIVNDWWIYRNIKAWLITREGKKIKFYDSQYDWLLDISKLKTLFQSSNTYNKWDYECFYSDNYYIYWLIWDVLVPLFSWFDSNTIRVLTGCWETINGEKYIKTCALWGCFFDKDNIYYPANEIGKYFIGSWDNISNISDVNIFTDC